MSTLQPEAIREALAGYAAANEVIENERMERLAHLMPEQSRAIFDDLVRGWELSTQSKDNPERLDMWRVETLITVRRAFEKMVRAKGLL
ncbi:MAG: hypothetical protein CVU38_00095 [Chloroflexi bacterium HGW-Chloroflexi-1]|nr:MAG: hypothetical protein CVU38_00095 [Chloroflexi bacterium HGW-Chloroflexi-1]